jgi:hypothetical protein
MVRAIPPKLNALKTSTLADFAIDPIFFTMLSKQSQVMVAMLVKVPMNKSHNV